MVVKPSTNMLQRLKRGVIRDLENLLNTRRELLDEPLAGLPEVSRSVKVYGSGGLYQPQSGE